MTEATEVQWLTTSPNPYVRGYGENDGQRGWRLHAVPGTEKETFADVRNRRALCGLMPSHGWGLDLFIDRKCKKCEAVVQKQGMEKDNGKERRD